jgi:hypothetical protein
MIEIMNKRESQAARAPTGTREGACAPQKSFAGVGQGFEALHWAGERVELNCSRR